MIREIQSLVRNGLYYLTEHADNESAADGFDIYDVEQGILTGKIRKTRPRKKQIRSGWNSIGWTTYRHRMSYN